MTKFIMLTFPTMCLAVLYCGQRASSQVSAEAAKDLSDAQMLCSQQHWGRAKPLLIKLARSRYANKQIYFLLAEAYQSEFDAPPQEVQLSEEYAKKTLALDQEFGGAYRLLSQIELKRDNNDKAIELATKALTCKEPDSSASYHRSKAYAAVNDYAKALSDMDLWLKTMSPKDKLGETAKNAMLIRGDILVKLGRINEALDDYRKTLPYKREQITQNIISCLKSQGKFAEAIAECTNLVQANPKDEMTYGIRARLKTSNHDLKGALGDYTKAIELMPTSRYYKERAQVYEQLGQKDLARKDLERSKRDFF